MTGGSAAPSRPRRVLAGLARRLRFVAYVSCLLTVTGFFGGLALPLELTSHFRLQYCLAQLVGVACCAAARRWWGLVVIAACLTANTCVIAPWFLSGGPEPDPERGTPLRVLVSNVYTSNTEARRLLDLIGDEEPDVVVLLEVDQRWVDDVSGLAEAYPSVAARPRPDNFGIAVYSRVPSTRLETVLLGTAGVPSIVARLELGSGTVTLVATHALPPVSFTGFAHRNAQLRAIAEFAAAKQRMIVVGDLNMTMWSPFHGRFVDRSGLRNARAGLGLLPTWPALFWPALFWPLMLPIDHCLVSEDVGVRDLRVGADIGSDHLPLIVDLVLP